MNDISQQDSREGWEGILDDDEKVLWQGRPAQRVQWKFRSPFEPFFYMFFTGFSIFWMVGASAAGGVFWMFGLLFFGVGVYQLIAQHFWKAYLRRNTFYTLTNKRAFIAARTATGRRKLDSYPLTPDRRLTMQEGTLATIHFATRETKDSDGDTRREDIGFELLENGREVYRMMRDIQAGQDVA